MQARYTLTCRNAPAYLFLAGKLTSKDIFVEADQVCIGRSNPLPTGNTEMPMGRCVRTES
jgi:hypothetical protein